MLAPLGFGQLLHSLLHDCWSAIGVAARMCVSALPVLQEILCPVMAVVNEHCCGCRWCCPIVPLNLVNKCCVCYRCMPKALLCYAWRQPILCALLAGGLSIFQFTCQTGLSKRKCIQTSRYNPYSQGIVKIAYVCQRNMPPFACGSNTKCLEMSVGPAAWP